MADFNWNEFGSGLLRGIASGLGSGDDNVQSPAPSVQAADFDISKSLPLLLIAGGVVALVLLLRK